MPLFKIPLLLRFTGRAGLAFRIKCMALDGKGFFFRYEDENELDPDNIRRHIFGREETWCYIQADSVTEAIGKFHAEWDDARVGGESREAKAIWINEGQAIVELPLCEYQKQNEAGEYTCGEPKEDDQGEFGMCVVQGFDAPPECPLAAFYDRKSGLEQAGVLKPREVVVAGVKFKFIAASDVLQQA